MTLREGYSSYHDEMLDITAPSIVEVELSDDCGTLWVNVNGRCRVRICGFDFIQQIGLSGVEKIELTAPESTDA